MAAISGILCEMITSDFSGAGTDGNIYLGIGGREFHLDSSKDDFERGSDRYYILGDIPEDLGDPPPVHVTNKDKNDPREGCPLDTDSLGKTPVYIRFESQSAGDNWNMNFAAVLVFTNQFFIGYSPQSGFDNLWMGNASGKIIYLTLEHRTEGLKLADIRAKLKAKMGR